MNLQTSLAFLLSVVALASGQDHCDNKREATDKCATFSEEDGWTQCQSCFEWALEGDAGLHPEIEVEVGCGIAMTKHAAAFAKCTKEEWCNVDCTNEMTALIDCGLSLDCAGHTVNNYIAAANAKANAEDNLAIGN